MRLKQVRLSGFKSFCDEAEFAFKDAGISVIVGPNGCGKSNVVDAVRWALGEQSPRFMRSRAWADVFLAGRARRPRGARAEVTLLFDNSDGTALEKYNEYAEIAVTRRLYRSGDSEYLINKAPCRLMDVRELVMDTGAAGRSYSIVQQGKVDEFVTASPQERRAFMEEAAGIVRYKVRRQAAEKKLEQTRHNLARVGDVIGELTRHEETLRDQVETARTYLALQDEVAMLHTALARLRHERSASRTQELEQNLEALRARAEQAETALSTAQAELERLRNEQAGAEQRLRERRGALYAKERQIQQDESQLALERQGRDNARQWQEQLRANLQELQSTRSSLGEQYEAAGEELSGLEGEAETLRQRIAADEQEVARHRERMEQHTARAKALREQLMEAHTELNRIAQRRELLGERIREAERRRVTLAEQQEARRAEQETARQTVAGTKERLQSLAEELTTAQARHEETAAALPEAEQAHSEQQAKEQALARTVMERRSRLDTLQEIEAGYEGFGTGVRTFLDWMREQPERAEALGVLGPLADQLSVPADVAGWAGDHLAPYLDVIVVRRTEALPELAGVLGELELGGLRFVALDSLDGLGPARNGHETLAGRLGLNGEAQALGQVLFGGTRLLPEATPPHPLPQPLGGSVEWLAADGSLHVDAKAQVTLGRAGSPAAGILQRRAEIAELEERLRADEAALSTAREETAAAAERIETLRAQLRSLQAERDELALAQREVQREAERQEAEAARLEHALAELAREDEQLAADLETHRGQLTGLDEEEAGWQAKRTEHEGALTEAGEAEAAARTEHDTASERLTQRRVEQGSVTSRLEALQRRRNELAAEQSRTEERIATTGAELTAQQEKLGTAEETIRGLEQTIAGHYEALEGLRTEERQQRSALNALEEQHRGADEQVRNAQRSAEAVRKELHEAELAHTQERMRRDQYAEQLAAQAEARRKPRHTATEGGGTAGDGAAEPSAAGDAEEADGGQAKGANVKREAPTLAPGEAQDENALQRRLESAQGRLRRMEGVNLGAPEEYDALTERLSGLETQRADLQEAIEDLESSIRRMNAESRRRFRETFDSVNAQFQALFPQVFGGGEAWLVMTDSEDPLEAGVDIWAQPPGKKLQSLNLLSGGEKALTAIALIFAFFLHKPSPFCLLDEVDAPLDDVNVKRFNRLIQTMTAHAQFIIITHNKRTMEVGDYLYGVTMEEAGVSRIVSVNLSAQAQENAAP